MQIFYRSTRLHRNADALPEDHKNDKTVLWQIESKHWQEFSRYAIEQNLRWVAGWAEHAETQFIVNACFEKEGIYLLLRTHINDR